MGEHILSNGKKQIDLFNTFEKRLMQLGPRRNNIFFA